MNRKYLKEKYTTLYEQVEEILYRNDPIGINFGDKPNEYDPEVDTILPRLKNANSEADVHNIIYEEFVQWFDAIIAGDKDKTQYKKSAQEIWNVWNKYKNKESA